MFRPRTGCCLTGTGCTLKGTSWLRGTFIWKVRRVSFQRSGSRTHPTRDFRHDGSDRERDGRPPYVARFAHGTGLRDPERVDDGLHGGASAREARAALPGAFQLRRPRRSLGAISFRSCGAVRRRVPQMCTPLSHLPIGGRRARPDADPQRRTGGRTSHVARSRRALPWRCWWHPLPCGQPGHPREQLVVTYLLCRRVDARRGVAVESNFCRAV